MPLIGHTYSETDDERRATKIALMGHRSIYSSAASIDLYLPCCSCCTEDMDCVLPASKLRCLVAALSFGCVFLWVLSGLYLDRVSDDWYLSAQPSTAAVRRQTGKFTTSPADQPGPRTLILHRRLLQGGPANTTADWSAGTYGAGGSGDGDADYDPATALCSGVHKINSTSRRCRYIKTVNSCQNDGGLLNYLQFIYCTIPYKLIPLAMVILFFWLVFLFIFLGATAEEYFCPALTVMSKVLHLSQNVAGVTLLALGNGAPDIFSAFAAISQSDDRKSSLAIGALFGAGIFVTTVVVGGVAFLSQFTLTKRPFLRDIIFYTIAVYWTFYLLWTNTVTIFMATGFIALYVFYVVVVIAGRIVYQQWKSVRESWTKTGAKTEQPTANGVNHAPFLLPSSHALTTGDDMKSEAAKPLIDDETQEPEESKDNVEVAHRRLGKNLQFSNLSRGNSTGSRAEVYQGGSLQVTTDEGASDANKLAPPLLSSHQWHPHPHKHRGQKPPPAKKEMSRSLLGANGPLFPQFGALLAVPERRAISPTANQERGWKYHHRRSAWDDDERPRSATPRKLLIKSLTGALGVSEEVVAAVGLPHVPEIWQEIHKVHPPKKIPLLASCRHHHHSGSEDGSSSRHGSFLKEEKEEEEEEESGDEITPLILEKQKKLNPLMRFLLAFYPFGEDFRELGLVGKIYEILKYPCGFILTLTVPVIDTEAELHNWNKWLTVLHCITGPLTVALLTEIGFKKIGEVFPVWALILFLGVVAALLVACTSWRNRRPVYHCVFAWLGFAIAVVWIYAIANEIVNLLQAFGTVVKLSDGILGVTLLAWGNSIGDAVANMTMARQGFPRMAIGACYGGPLLNMLIGVGVSSLYKTIKRRSDGFKFTLYFTQVEFFAAAFLIVTLAVSMAVITFSRYRIFRPVAVCLIVFYIVFLIISVLAEANVIDIKIKGVLSDH